MKCDVICLWRAITFGTVSLCLQSVNTRAMKFTEQKNGMDSFVKYAYPRLYLRNSNRSSSSSRKNSRIGGGRGGSSSSTVTSRPRNSWIVRQIKALFHIPESIPNVAEIAYCFRDDICILLICPAHYHTT